MSAEEIRSPTQGVWDNFYSIGRSGSVPALSSPAAAASRSCSSRRFIARCMPIPASPLTAPRVTRSGAWARLLAKPCRHLFAGALCPRCRCPRNSQDHRMDRGAVSPLCSGSSVINRYPTQILTPMANTRLFRSRRVGSRACRRAKRLSFEVTKGPKGGKLRTSELPNRRQFRKRAVTRSGRPLLFGPTIIPFPHKEV